MESTGSRFLRLPGSLTTNQTASGMGEGDEVHSSREDGWKSNPKESEVPWTPCDEEAYRCSISTDDDYFSGLRVFPEERETTKSEPFWISDASPTATTGIRRSVESIANNHLRTMPSVSTINQQSCDSLSDSTSPTRKSRPSESHFLSQTSTCGNALCPRPGSRVRLTSSRPMLRTGRGA